jgi:hypothetical protein
MRSPVSRNSPPIARCWPSGVPGAILLRLNPLFIAQSAKEVTFLYQSDHQVRHIYLDVPHSKTVKPSWYGESVGHYEGDTLVVDTIGITTKTNVDYYNTPHTDKLHVVERYRVIDGKTLEVSFTVDDAGALYDALVRQASVTKRPPRRWKKSPAPKANPSRPSRIRTRNSFPIPVEAKPDF